MSTKKSLAPPFFINLRSTDEDRIRAVLAEYASRPLSPADEYDRLYKKIIASTKVRATKRSGRSAIARDFVVQKHLSRAIRLEQMIRDQLSVEEQDYASEIARLAASGSLVSGIQVHTVHQLPSMSREQVISLSDRMYSRTLEEMQGEMYDDAE
ncbi:hypothetical protein [Klebsiella aerogenes]|uniref:hypothetical protein n=1 Tax=Klebsiella aerogenes TaxID=548 RepID=UPI0027848B8B|nr:hypothetical protein [Klebsiella aerogenes]